MTASDLSQARLEETVGSRAPAIRYLPETTSTNTIAAEWAAAGAPEGAIVVADHQTAGRGRLGRSWFGKPGAGINLSVVLRPKIGVDRLGLLNLAGAIAVCRAVSEHHLDSGIKWPNDVLIGERKVCGILAEANIERGRAVSVILGIGINVNLAREDFPEEISSTATSLLAETGHHHDRAEIIAAFLNHFGGLYRPVPEGGSQQILDAYRPLCITLGRTVRIEMGDGIAEGKALDIDEAGGLVLDSGRVVRVGDVVHLR